MKLNFPPVPDEWARRVTFLAALDLLRSERKRVREEMSAALQTYRMAAATYLGKQPSLQDLRFLEGEHERLSSEVQAWKKERWPTVLESLQAQVLEAREKETPYEKHVRENRDPEREAAAARAANAEREAMDKMRAWMIVNTPRRGE